MNCIVVNVHDSLHDGPIMLAMKLERLIDRDPDNRSALILNHILHI